MFVQTRLSALLLILHKIPPILRDPLEGMLSYAVCWRPCLPREGARPRARRRVSICTYGHQGRNTSLSSLSCWILFQGHAISDSTSGGLGFNAFEGCYHLGMKFLHSLTCLENNNKKFLRTLNFMLYLATSLGTTADIFQLKYSKFSHL